MSHEFSTYARQMLAVRLGIRNPDPESALHRGLGSVFDRLHGADDGVLNIALMWEFNSEMGRQGDVYATAKTNYDHYIGKAIVRYRAMGEKSAAVCEARANSEDQKTYQAHLIYRSAEQAVNRCKEALKILHAANENFRTRRADERSADSFTARTQT